MRTQQQPAAAAAPTFALFADGGHRSMHATKAAAIAFARTLGVESFAVYDDDDRQVFAEWPQPQWVLR